MRSDDRRDYEWLFRTQFTPVVRTVFLVVRDRAAAEEIAQDAFLELLQRWRTVAGYERPDAWVRRVAIRMAVRHARREGRRSIREASAVGPRAEELPDVDVARAVAALAPMQRAAVVLYYIEDRPVSEIARTLQVSESTIKQHLLRARSRLAETLREEAGEDVR